MDSNIQLTEIENGTGQLSLARAVETVGRISLALNATRDLSQLLDLICKESSLLFDVGAAFIWLLEGEELVGFAGHGYRRDDFVGLRVSLADSVILGPRVIREKRPMFVNDAPNSEGVDPELIAHFNTKAILGTPLIAGDRAIGALMLLDTNNPQRFGEEDVELAGLLGSHAAIAITNARLYEEISERVKEANRRGEELEALRKASFHLTANLELKSLLEAILEQAMHLIEASDVHIFLYDGENLTFGAARWADGRAETPYKTVRSDGLTANVARQGEAIIIPNANEHAIFKDWQWGGGIAGFPLKIGDEIVGVMNVATQSPHFFDDNEQRVLNLFADEAAIAIKNAQLFEETRRQLGELSVLHSFAVTGVRATDEDALIETTTKMIGDTFYPDNFGVLLLDEAKKNLLVHPSYRLDHKVVSSLSVNEGIVGRVATTGRSIRVNDIRETPYYFEGDEKTRSEICVPLKVGSRIMGVINAESSQVAAFNDNDERLLTTLAGQLAIALERLRTESAEQLQRRRLLIISELAREMTGSLKVKELCKIVSERILTEFGYYNVSIFLTDYDAGEMVLQHNAGAYSSFLDLENYRQPLGKGLVGKAAETELPQVYNDTTESADFFELGGMKILSEAALPLTIGDRVIGVLNVDSAEINTFSSGDIATLMAVADQLAIAIEKARLFEETSRHSQELDLLNKIISAAATARSSQEVLDIGCKELALFFDVPQAALALLDDSQTFETIVSEYLAPGRIPVMDERIPVASNPALQEVLKTGKPLAIDDVQNHPATEPIQALLRRRGTVSLLLIPIPVRGRIVGTLGVDTVSPRTFTADELRLAKTVGEELGRALETAELHEQLQAYAADLETRVNERTRELAEANEQLKELDRLKSKFVSDVSHELRTPVANLWLYLDLMERGRTERRDHYLDVLKQETRRLEQLIENTLNLSRLEMTDFQNSFEELDLNTLIDQVMVAYQPRAELDNLAFDFFPGDDLRSVYGIKNQLAQVVNNLLSNAFIYTTEGSVRVKTFADQEQEQAVLEVIDTGIGIDAEDLPHLFDRFYRGRHTGQSDIPGTGLGLAIAKEIVDLHRGTIEVDCLEEGETTFRVRLPYSRPK